MVFTMPQLCQPNSSEGGHGLRRSSCTVCMCNHVGNTYTYKLYMYVIHVVQSIADIYDLKQHIYCMT